MNGTSMGWSDAYYARPEVVRDKVVRCDVDVPLSTIAFLHRSRVSDVEFTGDLSGAHSRIIWEEIGPCRQAGGGAHDRLSEPLLANACSAEGFAHAARLGAGGLGLVRGEFLFAVAVVGMLDGRFHDGRTVADVLTAEGDWRALGHILDDDRLREELAERFLAELHAAGRLFQPGAPVFVRCFDYGDAYSATGGQRGTPLLLNRLPGSITFLARVLAEAQEQHPTRFVLGLPLVSSYAELAAGLEIAERAGVRFGDGGPGFGWEVETPAACLCTGLWADQLQRERGVRVELCGIGTNDLTQFTLARPRREATRPIEGRHEAHPAVLALLTRLARDCGTRSLTAVLSGVAGEDPGYRAFARELGFLVSCPVPALHLSARPPVPVLEQAVEADGLADGTGVAEAVGWSLEPSSLP